MGPLSKWLTWKTEAKVMEWGERIMAEAGKGQEKLPEEVALEWEQNQHREYHKQWEAEAEAQGLQSTLEGQTTGLFSQPWNHQVSI